MRKIVFLFTLFLASTLFATDNNDGKRVIVLDNGVVSDFDTPKNLLKHNKIYQEVYYSQLKGSDSDE